MENHHITFLRHGESTGNWDGFVQGQSDYPLSEKGIQQVKNIASAWMQSGRQYDSIICSPLIRASETAAIISEKMGVEVLSDPIWKEQDSGKLEGISRSEAYSDTIRMDQFPRFVQPGETGESTAQLTIRAGYALQSLLKKPSGKYLVISHGAFLNAVLHLIHSLGRVTATHGAHFVLLNTAYADYEYNAERNQWLMLGLVQPENRIKIYSSHEDIYRFVFLRHGQSEGNAKRMYQGQHETSLTETGRTQANEAGKTLKKAGYQFDRIIASPMERAIDTARLVNEHFGIPLTTDERLKEVHNGEMAGMTIDEIIKKYPGERPDQNNPYLPIGRTGESQLELFLRASEMVDSLLKKPPGEYLVVSHGGLLNNLILGIMGWVPIPRGRPGWMMFSNTSYAEFGYSVQQNLWKLLGFSPFLGH